MSNLFVLSLEPKMYSRYKIAEKAISLELTDDGDLTKDVLATSRLKGGILKLTDANRTRRT